MSVEENETLSAASASVPEVTVESPPPSTTPLGPSEVQSPVDVRGAGSPAKTQASTDPELNTEAKDVSAAEAGGEGGEFGSLFATMEEVPPIAPGQMVRCKVLKITDEEVIVNVGLKSEAALPRSEFVKNGQLTVAPGDTVDVLVESFEEEEGTVKLSHQRAAHIRAWEDIEKAFQDHKPIQGRVIERTKGGLSVDIGVPAFLPASQIDLRPVRDLDALMGQEIECFVVKLNKKRNNAVVSRKAVLEEELNRRKSELLAKLVEGGELVGRVKNLTDYGAFVDLGGMDGLLHITDLSWGRVSHPSEVVQVGQEIRLKVLRYVPDKDRVSLGLKQMTPDPWDHAPATYRVGDRIIGRVVSLTDYGAFVELEPGIEGLIHISEMTWSKRLKHPSKILRAGDRAEVVVLDVNPAQRRISLSLRQTLPDPWTTMGERLTPRSVIQGRVRNLTDFGAFIEVEEGVDGLIHISDLSWSKKVKHPSEVLKKGQRIEAMVLSLDPANRRLSLGLKQLQPDTWETFFAKVKVGDVLRGKVLRLAPFGAFVELEEGIEGLCHVSEMRQEDSTSRTGRVQTGHEYNFRVLRLSPEDKRIGLTMHDVEQEPEQPAAVEKAAATSKAQTAKTEARPEPPPEAAAASPPEVDHDSSHLEATENVASAVSAPSEEAGGAEAPSAASETVESADPVPAPEAES